MDIEKKGIDIVKTVYEGDIKSSAEGSIIVPDAKPDILRVSEVTAEAYLVEKQIEDGKITLKGKVRISIMYMPEGEEKVLESINGCLEFCETLKRSEFKEDMTLCAFCDVEKVMYKVLNSRKIGIETKILISVSVFTNEYKEMVSGVLSDNIQIKNKEISVTGAQQYEEFSFSVDEEIDFPKEKNVTKLLKADMCILSKENRALDGKLVIKGALGVCILYCDEAGKYNHLDCELPFTEVFDVSWLSEDEECEISYEIGETTYELVNAAEEAPRLKVTADIGVGVKADKKENLSLIDDCYFTNSDCSFSYEDVKMQSIATQIRFSQVLKQLLTKEDGAPDIKSVYRVQAKPFITSSKIENGKLDVSGKVTVYVLYLTDDEENPLASIKEDVPFNYLLDCDGQIADENNIILSVECEHISYIINSKEAVEVRCGLVICGKIVNILNESIISDISEEPRENTESGIVIYFVKEGDSLWDIAKHYRIKTDDILESNGLDAEYSPSKGEKLIIPLS